jgi:hypothetical protein
LMFNAKRGEIRGQNNWINHHLNFKLQTCLLIAKRSPLIVKNCSLTRKGGTNYSCEKGGISFKLI